MTNFLVKISVLYDDSAKVSETIDIIAQILFVKLTLVIPNMNQKNEVTHA